MSAPALAPTLTPATATVLAPGIVPSPAKISYSALFLPLPHVSLFQSPARPTLPSEAAVSQQQPSARPSVQQARPQPQQQTQPEHTASPSDDDDDDLSHFIAVSHPLAP
jgi:hypothetical protein